MAVEKESETDLRGNQVAQRKYLHGAIIKREDFHPPESNHPLMIVLEEETEEAIEEDMTETEEDTIEEEIEEVLIEIDHATRAVEEDMIGEGIEEDMIGEEIEEDMIEEEIEEVEDMTERDTRENHKMTGNFYYFHHLSPIFQLNQQ